MAMMLADIEGLEMPCEPSAIFAELKSKKWSPHMITNTLAYADGRKLFIRNGQWRREYFR